METDVYDSEYIRTQYKIYDEFSYMKGYADKLVLLTIDSGDKTFRSKLPRFVALAVIIIITNIVLLLLIITFSKMMVDTIVNPIIRLADASKKIAMNDFSSEDVVVANQDEVGELTSVFNSMKYATKERIMALEDRRHTEELLYFF